MAHKRKSTTISGSDRTKWHLGNWDVQDYFTHHDHLFRENDTFTALFEDTVSEQRFMTSAEEDEVGKCPINYVLGPVYTYCRNCEDIGMIYQPKPHSNLTMTKRSSSESQGDDEVGQCLICDRLGPA